MILCKSFNDPFSVCWLMNLGMPDAREGYYVNTASSEGDRSKVAKVTAVIPSDLPVEISLTH